MRYDKSSALWYRKEDKLIIDEVRTVYGPVPVQAGDVLLDLGAHIGAATSLLLSKGVAKSICIEADPENISFLRRNLTRKPATILWGAVGDKPGRVPFFIRADRHFVGSILEDTGRKRITVPVLPLSGLLEQYRPTIVKCDIEFAEYGLPELRALPDFVRVLTMEVHIRFIGIMTGRKQDPVELRARRWAAADLIAAIEGQGFREVWRQDKQAKPGEPPAEDDGSGIGPMTKCVVATWSR